MSNIIFIPRTTAPDPYSPYWQGISYGGYNKFNVHNMYPGCTLPNCTAYCEGRWMEIMGWTSTNLPFMNATYWYAHTSDGYPRGSVPLIGSIICWRNWDEDMTPGPGHVGVVEEIYYDGQGNIDHICVGYSASGGAYFTYRTNITPANGYKYKTNSALQGFIYLPEQPIDLDSDLGVAVLFGNQSRPLYPKHY